MLDSGAIVSASRPEWALASQRDGGRDRITDDITALITHHGTGKCTYWHYFELVRAGGNHEYHILLDENLGGKKFD